MRTWDIDNHSYLSFTWFEKRAILHNQTNGIATRFKDKP